MLVSMLVIFANILLIIGFAVQGQCMIVCAVISAVIIAAAAVAAYKEYKK